MNESMKTHGMFSWNELTTSNVNAAKSFYSELLGWSLNDIESPAGSYTMISVADKEIGGIMATPAESAGMPSAWTPYVTVDDVDARSKQAERLGGKVLVPATDIPEVGRFAVIQDPQGAMINLITYLSK